MSPKIKWLSPAAYAVLDEKAQLAWLVNYLFDLTDRFDWACAKLEQKGVTAKMLMNAMKEAEAEAQTRVEVVVGTDCMGTAGNCAGA